MKNKLFFSALLAGILMLSACSSNTSSDTESNSTTTTSDTGTAVEVIAPAELSTESQTTEDWKFRYDDQLDGIIIEECLCADKSTDDRVSTQDKDIVVPQTFDGFEGKQVLEIGGGAFRRIVCKSITLPDGLLYIDKNAFERAEITVPLTIPQTVTDIGDEAFAYLKCETVILPPIDTITMNMFDHANIVSITIPPSVRTIEDFAFMHCDKLADVTFSEGLETIGIEAFLYCVLYGKTIYLPSTLKSMPTTAFYHHFSDITLVYKNTSYYISEWEQYEMLVAAIEANA